MSQNWIQHTLGRRGWRPQRQASALAIIGLITALIVGALYLSQVSAEATKSRRLHELIAERDELERTNEQLRSEIASLRTVPRLLSRAQELGFVPAGPENIEYLVIEGYNPDRDQIVSQIQVEEPDLPVYDETFGGWVQQQWDALRGQVDRFGSGEDN